MRDMVFVAKQQLQRVFAKRQRDFGLGLTRTEMQMIKSRWE